MSIKFFKLFLTEVLPNLVLKREFMQSFDHEKLCDDQHFNSCLSWPKDGANKFECTNNR